jgi:hypothetical protein
VCLLDIALYVNHRRYFSRELFDVTLRLLVNLTSPELLLFKEELPEDKETRNYYLQIQVSDLATYKNTLTVFVPFLM